MPSAVRLRPPAVGSSPAGLEAPRPRPPSPRGRWQIRWDPRAGLANKKALWEAGKPSFQLKHVAMLMSGLECNPTEPPRLSPRPSL